MVSSSGSPDRSSALNGVPAAAAQRELTAGMEAAAAGELHSGHWSGGRREAADPITSYRVVIAVPGLHRAMENGLSTWLVGKGPSGQLASCSVPRDPGNPHGREAWLGQVGGARYSGDVTVEYQCGGIGHPNLDGTGTRVYANTLIGRCAPGIARVTVQYRGQQECEAVVAQGVWISQLLRGPDAGALTVRGYDAVGIPVAWRPFGPVSS
jgi:hypothetical protein